DTVLDNIRRINFYKRKYRSMYPYLRWQFIAFAHCAHEIEAARSLASDLDMGFWVKLPWNEQPAMAEGAGAQLRRETGAVTADEYRETFGKPYMADSYCGQLWNRPQVHTDGRVLGCCVNYWSDFGNAFGEGLDAVLNGERMRYARQMLQGRAPARDDVPCVRCTMYADMQRAGVWIDGDRAQRTAWRTRLRRNRRANRLVNLFVNRPVYAVLETIGSRLGLIRPDAPA